jgi:photosystem II stability/assembly factor-like uncharacterized protein
MFLTREMKKRLKYWPIAFLLLTLAVFLYTRDQRGEPDLAFGSDEKDEDHAYDSPGEYYKFYNLITNNIGEELSSYKTNYAYRELKDARSRIVNLKAGDGEFEWIHRGPGNVGGRTRAVIIDPEDATHNTWFAAAVSGGVWKTTDAGNTWKNLTDQLPNLATNCIAMASSDPRIIYIGTGEGYGGFGMVNGNGIFRSIDKGDNWELVASTENNENFKWINKIHIDPSDYNTVVAATNTGIFKTINGGASWDTTYFTGYRVQDMVINPMDSQTLYAGVNSLGIIKSYNFGDNWIDAYEGIGTGFRFSVAVSPVDTNYIFTSVEAPNLETSVYISTDGAQSWRKLYDADFTFYHFLGNQGWFNNSIEAHPFNKNKVFIGGVYVGSVEFENRTRISDPQVLRVDTVGTASFMHFVNFGGTYLGGGFVTGLDEDADVNEEDYVSVEIRFGPGISQKAHRFTVPEGEGAGVPPDDYTYRDYVQVPFEAWDTENNQQLMVSFRDQEGDGEFNLIERVFDDDISGREYIFVHAIDYSENASSEIAKSGGHYNKMLYFIWPTLAEDKTWESDNLPNSHIAISYGVFSMQDATTLVLADDNRNSDLHVDHHDFEIIITDEENEKFTIVNANDGGLGISENNGTTWRQLQNGYQTTQFYGVAKKPGAHEYIGGMQDNGTWQSPIGTIADKNSRYEDRVAGDGFEALWHPVHSHRILASTYYNGIRLSNDGGETWRSVTEGIMGDGPFITRLSNSPDNPDLVFAVGDRGVYRNANFCVGRYGWELIRIDDSWAVNDQVTSAHNVKVSLADPKIVWAGAGMFRDPDLDIFLSQDYGRTFESVNLYDDREMGYLTGIATHPSDPATAYLLFSMEDKPKILKTQDYGETWSDISGFDLDSASKNGFPDVMVYSLLVMPFDEDRIWAGTEIGIFESNDGGNSWEYANNGLPAVSVWQMFIQDATIVVATHGRGIWSAQVDPALELKPVNQGKSGLTIYPNPGNGHFRIRLNDSNSGEYKISVYNPAGVLVYIQSGEISIQDHALEIDLTNLPDGTYIFNWETYDEIISERLVIY